MRIKMKDQGPPTKLDAIAAGAKALYLFGCAGAMLVGLFFLIWFIVYAITL